jgi:hypothetical protein
MKQIFTFLASLLSIISVAQPTIQWQKSFGGSNNDVANIVQQTSDGGYVIAGYSSSNDSDITNNHGAADCWIVKLDSTNNLQWQKSFGGSLNEYSYAIQQTTDGGYIVACQSFSNDGDVTGHHGGSLHSDFWIFKIDAIGNIQWQNSFGGLFNDNACAVQQTIDGGYIVTGSTASFDGDVTVNFGVDDYWVIKLDISGNIQWQKSYGGTGVDYANAIQQTTDGGFIISGGSTSNDGDVTGHHRMVSLPIMIIGLLKLIA